MNEKQKLNNQIQSFLNFLNTEKISPYENTPSGFISNEKLKIKQSINKSVFEHTNNNKIIDNNKTSNNTNLSELSQKTDKFLLTKDNIKEYITSEKEKIGQNPSRDNLLSYLENFNYAKNFGLKQHTVPNFEKNCDILFFESIPSQQDITNKEAISGEKRELLQKILNAVELNHIKCGYANAINWIRKDNNYSLQDLYVCHPFNAALVNYINPKIVVSLGRYPLSTFGVKFNPNKTEYNCIHFSQKILYSESLHDIINSSDENVAKLKKKVFNDFKTISKILKNEQNN